jgi:hypothetical protein
MTTILSLDFKHGSFSNSEIHCHGFRPVDLKNQTIPNFKLKDCQMTSIFNVL